MKKKQVLLGINWEQNSTAALMIDGKIVGCSSEERFSRVKNDERYPINSINYLLKSFKIKSDEIDFVCFISKNWTPTYSLIRHYTKFSIEEYIQEQNKIWYPKIYKKKKNIFFLKIFKNKIDYNQYPGKKFWKKIFPKLQNKNDHTSNKKLQEIGKLIRSEIIKIHLGIDAKKVKFIDHSSGHIFYSFFSSNKLKNALAVSIDAFADFINYKAAILTKLNNKVKYQEITKGSNFIIARLYRYVTLILGLKPNEHEYKVMGMAPYSKEKYHKPILKKFMKLQDVKFLKFKNKTKLKDFYFNLKKLLDGYRFDSIAGGLQAYTEYLIKKWICNLLKKTKVYNLCLSGGVAMNVKNNLSLSEISKIKNVFVPPSPDDSSQSMGACYAQHLYANSNKIPKPLDSPYLGYCIDNKKVIKIIRELKSKNYKIYTKNINLIAANLISKNFIIARCVGRAEFGARSLGNRSILSNTGEVEIKKIINEKIKNRDFWMPFALTVIDKYAKKYFDIHGNLENYYYMTNCVRTKTKYRKFLSAAIHPYDYTCRPQVLTQKINKDYYDLIKKFGKITNTYALLNTSFNIHGFPLVNNERDAFFVFKKTNLDGLILGKYLILKKNSPKNN